MKHTHTPITGTQAHRVLIHYLLQEAVNQYNLVSAKPTFEEDLLERIIAENAKYLPEARVNAPAVKRWWRHVRVAIEFAGLNHCDIARVLSGQQTEFDVVRFRESMEKNAELFM